MREGLGWLLLGGGALAVLAALVALAVHKGGDLHRAAGRAFHRLVLGLAAVLIPVTVFSGDAFLAIVAVLAAYLAHSGRREVLRHRSGEAPGDADARAVLLLALAGVGFAAWGLLVASADGPAGFLVISLGFGALLVLLAGYERRRLASPPGPHGWLVQHVGAMVVSAVAVATAVGAATHGSWGLPAWVPWLAPTAIGTVLVLAWQARVRQDGREARFF